MKTIQSAFALTLLALTFGCSSGDTVTARFSDATGLESGAAVTVAGIEVGSVNAINVVDGQAQVVMQIDEGQDVALHEGACARLAGGGVTLNAGTEGDFEGDFVPACPPTLADRAAQLQNAAVRAVSSTAREAGRELSMTAAEFSAGLNEGSDELRETGSNLTMAGRAFAEGVEEGSR